MANRLVSCHRCGRATELHAEGWLYDHSINGKLSGETCLGSGEMWRYPTVAAEPVAAEPDYGYDHDRVQRRQVAVMGFLDLNLGQFLAWIEDEDVSNKLPDEMTARVAGVISGLGEDEPGLYLSSLSTFTVDELEALAKIVGKYDGDEAT